MFLYRYLMFFQSYVIQKIYKSESYPEISRVLRLKKKLGNSLRAAAGLFVRFALRRLVDRHHRDRVGRRRSAVVRVASHASAFPNTEESATFVEESGHVLDGTDGLYSRMPGEGPRAPAVRQRIKGAPFDEERGVDRGQDQGTVERGDP